MSIRSTWKSAPRTSTQFINAVRYLGPSFGGINLEDIKAPDCFIIEQQLREMMDIPVFHDDQHGTAIIAVAGLINALDLTGRDIRDIKFVCNGAGSAGIAVPRTAQVHGPAASERHFVRLLQGVIWKGREKGMNQWKSAHASDTPARTLEEALKGADVFFGLSVAGAITREMVASMAPKPIIFAMANPDPEITPEEVARDPRRRHHGDRAGPIIRTRSTMCSASRIFSGARSTCGPAPSTSR